MKWFRVEDPAEHQAALIRAEDARNACKVYIDIYPPDIFATPATQREITRWLTEPTPWTIEDQRGTHTHP